LSTARSLYRPFSRAVDKIGHLFRMCEDSSAKIEDACSSGSYVIGQGAGTPHLHLNFDALMDADDPDKLKQMIPS
jgi:hypothetical protein